MKTIFFSKAYTVVVTILLVISVCVIFSIFRSNKIENIYDQAVPEVELQNTLSFENNNASGKVVGFVAFENLQEQPKDAKQYIIIEAYNSEELNHQFYTVQNVYALQAIAPHFTDKSVLTIKNEDGQTLDLLDEEGNLYQINKKSGEVILIDVGGDIARLITSQTKFRDFIINWLK